MIYTETVTISTKGFSDIIDVSGAVRKAVKDGGIKDGLVTVAVPGSTAGVTALEYEPGLVKDLKEAFERLAPSGAVYAHNDTWGDGNGFSHVRAALLGPSRSFQLKDGNILLGTWQQIVVIDFDNRARKRAVIIQVSGEK